MLGILCTSHFCPDKSGRQVSLCSLFSNLEAIFELNRSFYAKAPDSGNRSIVIIEQGVTAIVAFDALNRMINSIAKLEYFSE
jgi:hypothetical protein